MAINTGNIEGFDAMTAEQKVEALLKLEVVGKDVFDKKASEAADLGRKLQAKLSDDEKAKEAKEQTERENAEKYADLERRFNDLTKKNTIAEYTARFLGQGYDKALAEDTAKALADGDMAKVFANGEKFKADLEKKIKADIMKNNPHPGGNGGNGESDPDVERAKKYGKQRAETAKRSADIMQNYLTK